MPWCFSQEDVYRALVTREIQTKTKVRRKHTPTIRGKKSSVGADTERLGPSYATAGSVNWQNSFRKPFVVPSKAGHKVALCPAILSKAYLKRNAYTCPSKDICKNVSDHCILSCHTLETVQMAISNRGDKQTVAPSYSVHTTLQSKWANTQRTTETKKLETKYYRLYVSTYVKFKEAQTNPWSYNLKTNQPVYVWVRGGDW